MPIKSKIIFLIALFLLIFPVAYYLSTAEPTARVISSYIEDEGKMELYFCPGEDCTAALVDFLDSAEKSIHCAFYDIGLKEVQDKLLEKSKKMEVLIVTDDDYLKKFRHPFVKADKYGLMHNKFCIIDNQKVSTGSMNPTENDAFKNNNNLLLIESEIISGNYEQEFQELWNGIFKDGETVKNSNIKLGNILIETYFCPEDSCAYRVKEELKKAEKSIEFMTFSFTHEGIANIILLKNSEGIAVKGIMETKQISQYSQFERLKHNGIEIIKDQNPNNLHHKVFIIDGETVITGSFNPSANGDERNDENLVIIHDKAIAEKFMNEFNELYLQWNQT